MNNEDQLFKFSAALFLAISDAISNKESDSYIGEELTEEKLTMFFTALTYASAAAYSQMTGSDSGAFEYSQIATHLVVQNMIEETGGASDDNSRSD